jgi:DNA gyrase subunit A
MRASWFEITRHLMPPPRVSEIAPAWDGIEDEDLIERDEMVVTVTLDGYIKRTPLSTFRAQHRAARAAPGMATKEEDAVMEMFVTSPITRCCSSRPRARSTASRSGACPKAAPSTRGRPIVNLLPRARSGRDHRHRPAAARGRGDLGRAQRGRSRPPRAMSAQSMDAFSQHPVERASTRCASRKAATTA